MTYYLSKRTNGDFDIVVARVVEALKQEGFGMLSDIDVSNTLKQKIGVDFPRYRILGACNPALAHKALQAEEKIGVMLPCNVIVQDKGDGAIDVAAIDPRGAMSQIGNPALEGVAGDVAARLARVVNAI